MPLTKSPPEVFIFLTTPRPPESFTDPVVGLFDSVVSENVEIPDTIKEFVTTLPVKFPENDVAVKVPFDELKVKLALLFVCKFPVAAVENNGKQVVSDASFATLTCAADPADREPALTHSISVPSDDKTCPLVPNLHHYHILYLVTLLH